MKADDDGTQHNKYQIEGDCDSQSAADQLLCREQSDDSGNEI